MNKFDNLYTKHMQLIEEGKLSKALAMGALATSSVFGNLSTIGQIIIKRLVVVVNQHCKQKLKKTKLEQQQFLTQVTQYQQMVKKQSQ